MEGARWKMERSTDLTHSVRHSVERNELESKMFNTKVMERNEKKVLKKKE
jgi:hypothetical protein